MSSCLPEGLFSWKKMKSPKKTKPPRIPITMTNQFDNMPLDIIPLPNARPVNFDHPYYQLHPWNGPRRRSYYATPQKLKVTEEEQKKTIGNPCEPFYEAEGIAVRDFAVEAAEQKKREEERMRKEAGAGGGEGETEGESTITCKKKKRVMWEEPETTA